jgi:hypothetical protein
LDSKERDTRDKEGFGERGEKLYNPRNKKNKTRESFTYDPADKKNRGNPKHINDELSEGKKEEK